MNELILFHPLYQERVWGGRGLETRLHRTLPAGRPIGESWDVVDRAEAQSRVQDGPWAGLTLRDLLQAHSAQIMGSSYPPERPFPILVKWLDCRERLSLQVHPPAEIAPALRGEPKTENWYIAEAEPEASLIVGLKRGTSRADFAKALVNTALEPCLHRFPVSMGDSILVRSGTVHAIDAGNLILEIQQNSDTTYRVYDWGRVGLDGKPRQMHVAESLASIDWTEFEPQPLRAARTEAVIAQAREFTIRRVPLQGSDRLRLLRGQQPRLLSVVQGAVEVHSAAGLRRLERGATALVPFAGEFTVAPLEDSLLLMTENFV